MSAVPWLTSTVSRSGMSMKRLALEPPPYAEPPLGTPSMVVPICCVSRLLTKPRMLICVPQSDEPKASASVTTTPGSSLSASLTLPSTNWRSSISLLTLVLE